MLSKERHQTPTGPESLNPPETENVRIETFEQAIAAIEEKHGLANQPRVIIFHEKEGRRHCHAVWSRIDVETMTAKPLPFFKNKLMEVSKQLYLEHGWQMPKGSRAAAMRSDKNREIGFVINQISNPFNAVVIFGVSDLLEADDYLVSVLNTRDDTERQGRHLEAFIRNGRGGLLGLPALDTPAETFSLLRAHSIPVVTFLRRTEMGGFYHVGIRTAEATVCATRHLIDGGHRHIAHLGGDIMTNVRRERIDGYTMAQAVAELGPPIIWDCQDNTLSGLMAMQALRRAHPDVTGVVCNGDTVALSARLALQRDGLVPEKPYRSSALMTFRTRRLQRHR